MEKLKGMTTSKGTRLIISYYLQNIVYHKIPKISRRAYIFQRPFLRGLHTEGSLHFKIGWAYTWMETCVLKSIGLAYS